ncbi:MAG: NAD(+)/NADH kinase [Ruminococcus sp.]|nr:NAD(+)/NADH kinase [Ruminococcus sp.]
MNVFIMPNLDKNNCYDTVISVCEFFNSREVTVFMSELYKSEFSTLEYVIFDNEEACAKNCDIIIAVGGDGTILSASGTAYLHKKKLLGINCGRLGFMANLEHDEIPLLENLLTKNYSTEKRMMLNVTVNRGEKSESYTVLNDVVISKPHNSQIADFIINKNSIPVSHIRADGVIFSTPTGATAYSLSAGGPIIEPDMECFEFTPICPHTLLSRTIIFSKNTKLTVQFVPASGCEGVFNLMADGNELKGIASSDSVEISLSTHHIELIDIKGGSFFKSVTNKLMKPLKPVWEEE